MNAQKLRHIVEVDRRASISAAAKFLNLTQSTVSRSVLDIEREIGYPLFERRAREVAATEKGRAFINRAARIISDLDQLSDDAKRSQQADSALIRVGLSPASIQGLANRAIKELLLRRTDLRVHIEAVSEASGVNALRRGDLDVLVGPESVMRGDTDFAFERLGDLNTHLFVRRGHPLLTQPAVRRRDIANYPVIAPDRMSWHTDRLCELFAAAGGDGSRRLHIVEYFPLIADIVSTSDAIGVIAEQYSATNTFSTKFAVLGIDFFKPLSIGLAVRKKWLPSPGVRALQASLRQFPPGIDMPHPNRH